MNNRRSARRRRVRDCGFCQDDVDKISAVEYLKLFSLIEVIYTRAVFTEIERLCEENCCGYKVDHPSQRQHDCLMLTEEERWELYYKKAVALLDENRSVWDEFIEATRVLKLGCHKDALEYLRHLEREFEIALYTLWQLNSNQEDREINCILGYLAYWRESNK